MVIFHSYVSLPEGKTTIFLWFSYDFPIKPPHHHPKAHSCARKAAKAFASEPLQRSSSSRNLAKNPHRNLVDVRLKKICYVFLGELYIHCVYTCIYI